MATRFLLAAVLVLALAASSRAQQSSYDPNPSAPARVPQGGYGPNPTPVQPLQPGRGYPSTAPAYTTPPSIHYSQPQDPRWSAAPAPFAASSPPAAMLPPSTIRVYRVAELVAAGAVNVPPPHAHAAAEGADVEQQTVAALNELATLVRSIAEMPHCRVQPHAPTLSLVVRHTEEGHKEIARLLEQLAQDDEPVIELTFRLVEASRELPEEQESLLKLVGKASLTADEAKQAEALCESPAAGLGELRVRAVNGRRTGFGPAGFPMAATAVCRGSGSTVQLRLDYFVPSEEGAKASSRSLSLADGGSAFLVTGDEPLWLVTARVVEPAASCEACLCSPKTKLPSIEESPSEQSDVAAE
jgi:hypothetical protein